MSEKFNGTYHWSLVADALLHCWSGETDRDSRTLASALNECLDLMSRGVLNVFFDRHGAYIGHVVAARLAIENGPPVLHHPAIVSNRGLWIDGPPNWVVWFEARNGYALPIVKRVLGRLPRSVRELSYVRTVRGDVFSATWSSSVRHWERESCGARALWDHERAAFQASRQEKVERGELLSLLAKGPGHSLPLQTALRICSWAYNLRQYRITANGSTLLIWALCSPEGLDRMRRARATYPEEGDWNAGNIPVLIATSGTDADVCAGVRDWMAALPAGAASPHRLVTDRLFDRYGIEPL